MLPNLVLINNAPMLHHKSRTLNTKHPINALNLRTQTARVPHKFLFEPLYNPHQPQNQILSPEQGTLTLNPETQNLKPRNSKD